MACHYCSEPYKEPIEFGISSYYRNKTNWVNFCSETCKSTYLELNACVRCHEVGGTVIHNGKRLCKDVCWAYKSCYHKQFADEDICSICDKDREEHETFEWYIGEDWAYSICSDCDTKIRHVDVIYCQLCKTTEVKKPDEICKDCRIIVDRIKNY